MARLIYPVFDKAIDILKLFNPVEWLKWSMGKKNEKIAIDLFILGKWIFLIVLILFRLQHSLVTIVIWILIVSNLFTYFFYHIWDKDALILSSLAPERIKRRFLNLLLAIGFSIVCFAYLFYVPYSGMMKWPVGKTASMEYALQYSFSSALAANYSEVTPNGDKSNLYTNVELLISFIFITIVLSRSIPQADTSQESVQQETNTTKKISGK